MNDPQALTTFQATGVILTETVIPIIILICFVTILATLWRAKRTPDAKRFRYFLNAIGFFVLSLALPFLAFPVQLVLDLSESRAFSNILLIISAASLVSGTYCLVKGAQQLRANADAA